MSILQSEKYFNDCEPLVPSKLSNTSRILYEKIKLQFSIRNAKNGTYSLQGKLYDKQVLDFFSEALQVNSSQQINFSKFLTCDFYFEKEQTIEIIVFKNRKSISIKTTLGKIIASKNCMFSKNYSTDEYLVIRAEKLQRTEELLDIKFNFNHNSIPNFFKNNKMYFIITSSSNNNKIYKSAEIKKDGTFDPIHIPVSLLQPYYIVNFFNLQNNSIFSFNWSTQQIKYNEKFNKQINLPYNSYIYFQDNSEITKNYTFIDYVKAGVKIALSIGIDFTGSNGDPLDYGTLHCLKGTNHYEKAIRSCGNIVGIYDYDQKFPVFGFGAIINNSYSKEPSMCFNLNFQKEPDIYTIDNVLKIYNDCIKNNKLTFSGPTEFAPLIREVMLRINQKDLLEYHILMILTDGVIDDLQETIDVLVKASKYPLSVIIIGIGKEDFSKMEILDGDEVPLTSSKGEKRMRDLVQFVPFAKYQNDEEKLTMEVLAEIPRQMIEFYQYKNLNPKQIEILAKKPQVTNNNPNHNANINNNFTSRNQNQNNIINNQPNQNGIHYDNVRNYPAISTMDNTRSNPHPQNLGNAPPPIPSSFDIRHINNISNNQNRISNNRNMNNNGFNTSRHRNTNNNYNLFNNTTNQINNNNYNNNYQHNNNAFNSSFQQNSSYYTHRNYNNNSNQSQIQNNNRNNNQRYNNVLTSRNNYNMNLNRNNNLINNNQNMNNFIQNNNNYQNVQNSNQIDLNNLPIYETIKLNKK